MESQNYAIEPEQIIAAFLELIDYTKKNFSQETLDDLAILQQNLQQIANEPLTQATDKIEEWCRQHADETSLIWVNAREIKIQPARVGSQEKTLENQFPDWQEKTNPPTTTPPATPPNTSQP